MISYRRKWVRDEMTERLKVVFGEGFRIFFLAAAIYAVFSISIWEGWLAIHALGGMVIYTPFVQVPHLWHAHEMIYGYATAAMGGFFLTAVPSWTGAKAARHTFIVVSSGTWLAARLAIWWSGHLDPLFVAIIDLAFLPILAAKIATQLVRRPKPQNLMFLALLTIIWSGNLLMHLEWLGIKDGTASAGARVGLLGIAAMIAVLGGRVTPAFTRNAMTREGIETDLPHTNPKANIAGIAAAIALPVSIAVGAPDIAIALIALMSGAAQLIRLSGWRTLWTLNQPILWSLHLAYAMLAMGYLLLALSYAGFVSEISAIHILGIGAVGGMTLAVMSRAILGHSGLPLKAPRMIAIAYGMIALAAAFRMAGSLGPSSSYFLLTLISGGLWIMAFTLFISVFWSTLTTPRSN